ncbi:hypothetical protein ACHQM5_017656 [Ranunculus cassubicifolius]
MFQQFSDQLRLQGSGFSNLSINDSIWSNSFTAKRPEERRNIDIRVGAERSSSNNRFNGGFKNQNVGSEINGFNNGWKIGIFVCNNDTMQENLRRQLFGLPPRYMDSVRAITPGLPLFLYNYSNHQLHGIFEASSFGGTNIDPTAWEDKKSQGESRFPAQEDSFRPILYHYDGPKFRLELSVQEALALLDVFA